jgi:sigma-E factor negative regulatory protein RseA
MKQRISEWMDGELETGGARAMLTQVAESRQLRSEWVVYHTIGDGMRGSPDVSPGFLGRVCDRLADEPTILAPRAAFVSRPGVAAFAMYAAASLAAVAVVGWLAFAPQPSPNAQIANQGAAVKPAPKPAAAKPELTPLKPEDHDFLLAHQAVSPSGNMQGVAPYVRTVAFGSGANGR